MENRLFSFPGGRDTLKHLSLHQLWRTRSPPPCLPSMKGGSRTRKVLAKKMDGEHKCSFYGRPGSGGYGSRAGATCSKEPLITHPARGTGPVGRDRAARDPWRARGGADRSGLSGPRSRGLYDTALARGTGRGWLRGRRLLHAVHLAVNLERSSLARTTKYRACALK